MPLSQKQIAIIMFALLIVGGLFAAVFFLGSPKKPPAVTLKVWGVGDSKTVFDTVSSAYATLHPEVTIEYKSFDPDVYDGALLNALAAGQGPDVFMVLNRAFPRQGGKLSPVPRVAFSVNQLRTLFPTVVEQDFSSNGDIYALPLYLDTLALFYNRDRLDRAAIVAPPATWDEFQDMIPSLRSLDQGGRITRAAAAIGGSERTSETAVDLVHLLMLQNGTNMVNDERNGAVFASQTSLGTSAFAYYLQFANPTSPYYTWNDLGPLALDSFTSGDTAMVFAYHDAESRIRKKSPFLNFAVASVPQVKGSDTVISYPRYYGLAVSRQSSAAAAAWDFVVAVTTNKAISKIYLDATNRPPALRSLIAEKLGDAEWNVFAKQALTARSWYEADDLRIEAIFNDAIVAALSGSAMPVDALKQAETQVSQLMKAR